MWAPGVASVFPPLLAVVVAVISKNALLALSSGVVLGAWLVHGPDPLTALARTVDTHLPETIASEERASMLIFTLSLGGFIGVLARSGSTRALVDLVSARARSRRAGLLTAWVGGMIVFFDDYANCLLVGSTMRPLTDRLRISREKLAYLLDSTAAPLATVAVISTWIGFQLGLLGELASDSAWGREMTSYQLFLSTIPFAFYSLLTLFFVGLVAASGRDFGPMLAAERRAVQKGLLVREGAVPLVGPELDQMAPRANSQGKAWGAIVPLLSLIVLVAGGLYSSGREQAPSATELREILAAAQTTRVLLWTAFGGGLCAAICALVGGSLSFDETLEAWLNGAKAMINAAFILALAWALGTLCKDHLGTGTWVVSHVQPTAHLLPVLTFLLCGITAFATGSSFSTMAIMIPIAGPMALAFAPGEHLSVETLSTIRLATLGAVLSGAVFGDHCSPLSDTTVLSSMGAGSDHVDHVRTQAPYALVCAAAAAVFGYLPSGYGVSPVWSLVSGMLALTGLLWWQGKVAEVPEVTQPEESPRGFPPRRS